MIGDVLRVRYELKQLLLEGPVFSLYAARDRQLGREVAVRLVKAPFSQEPEFVSALKEAVKRSQVVNHHGVEKLHEVEDESGMPFIVGDLSKGASLAERIRKLAPYSVPVSIAMTVSLLESLDALHRAGIVHGDVNSNNVVVQADGTARLQLGGIWQSYSASTTAGAVVLPSMAPYLAPEISSGSMPSPSSDVYAVGVILFQLLTGRQPYMGDTPVAVAMKHSTAPTPSVRTLNPSVPAALDEVVKKAMAKDSSERYVSAGDMLADLRVIEDAVRFGRPVSWPIRKVQAAPAAPAVKQHVAPKMSAARKDPKDLKDEREERDVPVWMMVLFAAVVGVAACMVGLWMYFNLSTPRLVTVPQVQGLSVSEARSMIQDLDLRMRIGGRASSERIPADSVLEVNPSPGQKVREGGTVTVKLSSGSRFVEVPDLRGRTLDAAKSLLSSLDLQLDERVETVRDFSVKEGLIVRQTPDPRIKVERFTPIRVYVSGGRSGSGSAEDDQKEYIYTLNIKLQRLQLPVILRVDVSDARGTRVVYERRHSPEEEVEVSAKGYGPTAVFRIYYDNQPVKTVNLDAEEDATPAEPDE